MPSIQSSLMSQPLPLSEAFGDNHGKSKAVGPDQNKVAKDFESLFTSMILKEMRNTLEPNSLFGEDSSDIYGGMFDMFLGQHLSEVGGIGLAKVVTESLKHLSGDVKPQTASAVKKP